MNLRRLLISASSQIVDRKLRWRAELLAGFLLCRLTALIVICVVNLFRSNEAGKSMIPVIVINLIAYGISRTKFRNIGAYIVLYEPIIGIPIAVIAQISPYTPALTAPLFLALGPMISSLILSMRRTVELTVLSTIAIIVIICGVPPEYRSLMIAELLIVISFALIAVVATVMRDQSDAQLITEQSKVLQSTKLASLGEMAAGVAHELNSPLCAIVLNVELLEEDIRELVGGAPDVIERLRAVGEVADRMSKIINGLRSFSRDASKEDAVLQSAESWITDSLDLCQQRFYVNGVKIDLVSKNLDTLSSVRPIQMSQVLISLLNNSFDAIEQHADKWIRIEAEKNSGYLEVSVTDGGKGLAPEVIERLFEPFFTTKDYGRGTGLGLSIARGIMQVHRGELFVDRECVNTRFVIRLPIAEATAVTEKVPKAA